VSPIEGEAIKIGVYAWAAAIELRLDSQQSPFYHSALAHIGAELLWEIARRRFARLIISGGTTSGRDKTFSGVLYIFAYGVSRRLKFDLVPMPSGCQPSQRVIAR